VVRHACEASAATEAPSLPLAPPAACCPFPAPFAPPPSSFAPLPLLFRAPNPSPSGRPQTGSVYAVRVLGALAMIDGGETDWKVLAVRTDDPLAQGLTGECEACALFCFALCRVSLRCRGSVLWTRVRAVGGCGGSPSEEGCRGSIVARARERSHGWRHPSRATGPSPRRALPASPTNTRLCPPVYSTAVSPYLPRLPLSPLRRRQERPRLHPPPHG